MLRYLATEIMSLETMLRRVKKYLIDEDLALLERAYHFAEKAHFGQTRKNGDTYFIHPCAVASILIELQLDIPTIAAGLMHDTAEDCASVTIEGIKEEFGEEIANLVDGVTKLENIKYSDKEVAKAENIRKMILAMSKDIRVVLIKLADRLHNMRTLRYQSEEKQKSISKETLEIYAALAHRLGVNSIKSELEDLSFKYLEPEEYKKTAALVGARRAEREEQINNIIHTLVEKINKLNIKFEIDGRPKHLYSIYKKMSQKGKSFDQIYDIIAVRILVENVEQCYAVLGIVHTLWTQVPGRFKDYISVPKANMYQSVHTTMIGGRQFPFPFEVQIRTFEMHRIAEFGIAAHWRYKEKPGAHAVPDKKMYWLGQILDWQKEMADSREFIDALKTDLFSEEVLIFTPKGDIIDMPAGATPIDFAYRVHSEVGNRCVGAKVNGKIVPLNTRLRTGDRVDIITNANSKGPSMDWLKVVKTPQARTRIKQFFKHAFREENILKGKDMVEKETKRQSTTPSAIIKREYYEPLLKKYAFNDIDDIFGAVGYGGLTAEYVVVKMLEEKRKQSKEAEPVVQEVSAEEVKAKMGKATHGIYLEGQSGMLVHFARCCNPVPGDDIVGFITHGRGVTIHKEECANILNTDKARLIKAAWAEQTHSDFDAGIQIVAYDHLSLLGEIAMAIGNMNVSIVATSAKKDEKRKIATFNMVVKVNSKDQLEYVIRKLKQRQDVIDVFRGTGN